MASKPELDEEEVLFSFSAEPNHDRKTLERYLLAYPAYAEALVDYSIELMRDTTSVSEEIIAPLESSIDHAWQQFQAAVVQPLEASVANAFTALDTPGFRTLATRLNINNLLLIRLRDRAISAATIPSRFVQLLAAELGVAVEACTAYLNCPPAMVSEQSFRSSVKPAVTEQISFEKALATSQLTQLQQDTLKALQD